MSGGSVMSFDRPGRPPVFLTIDGLELFPPENGLFVPLNPDWGLPEDVHPKPRDERFADVIEPDSRWDPRTWWYDTGNFGAPGLVVRTVAEVWGIDVVELVNRMEPLHLQDGADLRPAIPTADGGALRPIAIRIRR